MGIGNADVPNSCCPRLRAIVSLPLMEIGNLGVGGARPAAARAAHYPSWGLETGDQAAHATSWRARRSLPLMGIGNLEHSPASGMTPVRRWPHYPSWGLETSSPYGANNGRSLSCLITPHGDWKPGQELPRPRSKPPTDSHYPSWGLETRGCSIVWHGPIVAVVELITPHGDWKQGGAGPAGTAYGARAHYPSWGLETPGSTA